jgi:hypothetical protein
MLVDLLTFQRVCDSLQAKLAIKSVFSLSVCFSKVYLFNHLIFHSFSTNHMCKLWKTRGEVVHSELRKSLHSSTVSN